jgi:hypothetical protein
MLFKSLLLLLSIFLLVSQSLNTVSKLANRFLDIIITEQFDFGRDVKKISGFQNISSKIRDAEKIILLILFLFILGSQGFLRSSWTRRPTWSNGKCVSTGQAKIYQDL